MRSDQTVRTESGCGLLLRSRKVWRSGAHWLPLYIIVRRSCVTIMMTAVGTDGRSVRQKRTWSDAGEDVPVAAGVAARHYGVASPGDLVGPSAPH